MTTTTLQYSSRFIIIFIVLCFIPAAFSDHRPKTFIVHVARSQMPSLYTSHHHWYTSILNSLDHPSPKLLYTYEKAINGFAATLNPSQATKLAALPGILAVLPDRTLQLATTSTYKFLGLSKTDGLWPSSNYGDNITIAVLDTGIWPERRSFSDTGLSPAPSSWRKKCEISTDFPASSCNQKIIGARTYKAGYSISTGSDSSLKQQWWRSPRDRHGHGTHVASIAAGAVVSNASFYGFAQGEARGMATRARIAVYKVLNQGGKGTDSDTVAAIEKAILDGVDIINYSVGDASGTVKPYDQSNVAIATFGAMQNGILFSAAAGNTGPKRSTVTDNLAPWVVTVGASSINREFGADVILGDGSMLSGDSLYYDKPLSNFSQVVYAGDFGNGFCDDGSFTSASKLAGKIIVCDSDRTKHPWAQANAVLSVNGVGMILINMADRGEELLAEPHHIVPTTRVSLSDGIKIKEYTKTASNPTAKIMFLGTVIGSRPPAPKVAAFSSRGPNPLTPQILKPDVVAPGLNILAAWSGETGPWGVRSDRRRVEFNVMSGTSMACPHVSGLAALLRKTHPTWSPSAIKSALMTTSYDMDNSGSIIKDLATGNKSTPFVHGSGHVDPNRATDPGLVYDMDVNDYVAFLCSIGYDSTKIELFLKKKVSSDECDKIYTAIGARVKPGDLNLPSFAVEFNTEKDSVTYRRRVTNVGKNTDAVYKASVVAPAGIHISVSPSTLLFSASNLTQRFTVTFTSPGGYGQSARFGSIVWTDGTHSVRSPVAISWKGFITTGVVDELLASM